MLARNIGQLLFSRSTSSAFAAAGFLMNGVSSSSKSNFDDAPLPALLKRNLMLSSGVSAYLALHEGCIERVSIVTVDGIVHVHMSCDVHGLQRHNVVADGDSITWRRTTACPSITNQSRSKISTTLSKTSSLQVTGLTC